MQVYPDQLSLFQVGFNMRTPVANMQDHRYCQDQSQMKINISLKASRQLQSGYIRHNI